MLTHILLEIKILPKNLLDFTESGDYVKLSCSRYNSAHKFYVTLPYLCKDHILMRGHITYETVPRERPKQYFAKSEVDCLFIDFYILIKALIKLLI